MFGYEPEEVVGRRVLEFAAPSSRSKISQAIKTKAERTYVAVGLRKDGATLPLEVLARNCLYGGQPARMVALRNTSPQRQAEQVLRLLPGRIIEAQEAERHRVARELHDGIGQVLASAKFRLHDLEAAANSPAGLGGQGIARVRELVDQAANEVRRLSQNLRPSLLDDLGLEPALRGLCEDFHERTGVAIHLDCHELVGRLSPHLELVLFRIAQEALNNVEKHAQASRLRLSLAQRGASIELHVQDNGRGFHPKNRTGPRAKQGGLGLMNMQERASIVDGTVELKSAPGEGAEVVVRVPVSTP
jgi:two-component system NarL family sensor kinase